MSLIPFEAPTLEALAVLLPAYDFESFIAQGGMGAVYKARQRALDRDVAIKILPRELGDDPDFRKSFETEAIAMARLNHPNLIGVYDSGDLDGMLYIVMEYVNGKSLYHSAYNLAVDPEQAASLVKGICDGLAHAHEFGVIHRDIKPANILLNEKVVPKIGDFGLARPSGSDGPGLIMGTPGYTAPEIYEDPEHADQKTDIFAVGVILYELLTGRRPEEEAESIPPSAIVGCNQKLDVIWRKATHPDPAQRYDRVEEMAKDLEGWAHVPETTTLRTRQIATGRLPHVPTVGPRGPAVRVAGAAVPRRAPVVIARKKADYTIAKIIAVILLAGGGLIVWKSQEQAKVKKEIEARQAAQAAEVARVEALKKAEADAEKKEVEDKPDPKSIRFAPEPPAPGTKPEGTPIAPPAGLEPPPP